MPASRYKFGNQCGLVLIEMVIAIAIGGLLLGLIVEIYLEAKNAQQLQTAINDIEFNANRTIAILSNDLKRAGHIGCARLTADFPLKKTNIINANNKIVGKKDEIQIRYVDLPAVVLRQMSMGTLMVSNEKIFKENDILMISDCHKAEVFRVKSNTLSDDKQYIVPVRPLNFEYGENAEIGPVINNRYFLDKTDGGKRLFVEDIHHKRMSLVDNIEEIFFLFTVKQGYQSIDVHANEVTDWSQLVGVAADIKVITTLPALEKNWHMYVALSS